MTGLLGYLWIPLFLRRRQYSLHWLWEKEGGGRNIRLEFVPMSAKSFWSDCCFKVTAVVFIKAVQHLSLEWYRLCCPKVIERQLFQMSKKLILSWKPSVYAWLTQETWGVKWFLSVFFFFFNLLFAFMKCCYVHWKAFLCMSIALVIRFPTYSFKCLSCSNSLLTHEGGTT